MTARGPFTAAALDLDAAAEADRIAATVRDVVLRRLRRRGVVLGLSGGVDSSVTAALCVKALGRERVLGLLMPEAESAAETTSLGRLVAAHLGVESVVEDIGPILETAGCYRRRDEAIRTVIPEYGAGYACKLVLRDRLSTDRYATFSIVVRSPSGARLEARLTLEAYLTVVAATSFKQRVRKMLEYYHADRLRFAVVGTPNRLEHDQGFFVKNGDGAADLKPIAHLYKSQVYQLGAYLGIPADVMRRTPTTDTYPLQQTQEEFYFVLPYDKMDLCLYGKDHGIPPADVAGPAGLTPEQVERVYRDIDAKRRATAYLHEPPVLADHQ